MQKNCLYHSTAQRRITSYNVCYTKLLRAAQVRSFFETRFVPHQLRKVDGDETGLATGYYVPDLRASRQPSPDFSWPLYRRPDDLLVVDLLEVYPALADYRLV